MKIKIDDLTPGERDIGKRKVNQYKTKLANGEEVSAITVVKVSGRTHVRDGGHRVRATIEHCEANGLPLEIECEEVSAADMHPLYPAACDSIFKEYGSGTDAFKKVPYKAPSQSKL